jgi:hypothetical protein
MANSYSTVVCEFVATEMCLLSRCLATIGGDPYIDTETKQANNKGTVGGSLFSAVQPQVI